MKKIPRLVLRENQVLTGASMGHLVGGYELPEVVIYGYYGYSESSGKHTGDATTCPKCSKVLPGTDNGGGGLIGTVVTYGAMIWCACNEGKRY